MHLYRYIKYKIDIEKLVSCMERVFGYSDWDVYKRYDRTNIKYLTPNGIPILGPSYNMVDLVDKDWLLLVENEINRVLKNPLQTEKAIDKPHDKRIERFELDFSTKANSVFRKNIYNNRCRFFHKSINF